MAIEHLWVPANGATFYVARAGQGLPLLLLHDWPKIWLIRQPVMARLADRYTPIAPDLCGFGDSDKPTDAFGPQGHVEDLLALLDALQVEQVGIVGHHDVGGAVMRALARTAPQRCAGLFFSSLVYPGIGARMAAPDRLNGIWHQSFNQTELATRPVGTNRESCGAYIAHFPAALGPSQRRVRQCPRCVHR